MATTGLAAVQESWLAHAIELYEQQRKDYEKFDEYYDGEQPLAIATDRWRDAFGTTFSEFEDNWCQVVCDTPAQRLEIIGWQAETDKRSAKIAEAIWDESHVDQEQEDLHLQTFIKGDGYIMVWPDPEDTEQIDMFFNDALDVNVQYDPSNKRRVLRASKKWINDDGALRLNLYYPDRIEQYIVPRDEAEAMTAALMVPIAGALPQGWKKYDSDIENKWGEVPIFHFKNRARGSTHGMSEIKSVIPIQNAINKVLMDMMLGSEFTGFPSRWMAGGGHPPNGWKTGPNRLWATTDPNAKFGQFDQMDLDPLTKFIQELVGHVAKITQTPMHYLRTSGDMPSGEALKTAESGLVHKCKNRIRLWGHTWSHAMTLAVQMKTGTEPRELIYPVYRSPETRHDLEQAQTAQLKSILGVPLRQLWSEHFGYTEEQIEQFEEDNQVIAAAALAQMLAQDAQVPPGAEITLGEMLGLGDADDVSLKGMSIPQLLAQLSKSQTGRTTAGEATTNPQPNTRPPASPTRRSTGFKD